MLERPLCQFYKELATLDGLSKKAFPVYADLDVFTEMLPKFSEDGQETLIDSAQDDDVESDEEVVRSGEHTSYNDLLVVKDWLRKPAEHIRVNLKTFKLWAPMFGGQLPYKKTGRSRAGQHNEYDKSSLRILQSYTRQPSNRLGHSWS